MSDTVEWIDYEPLVLAELEHAARSPTRDDQRAHLDQAAIFATLGERQRDLQSDDGTSGGG